MIKLYGFPTSPYTRLVALVCKEERIAYEFINVDVFGKREHKEATFMEKQPFGQVPYIDDNGFILYESHAIARYLIKKYSSQAPLIPTDLREEALFEQAASIERSNFNPFVAPIVYEKLLKPRRGLQPNEARISELLTTLNRNMDAYDVILGKQKYLAGDSVTLADLSHLPFGAAFFRLDASFAEVFESRPNVARWWKDITNRPTWLAVKDGA
ncbi:glutathione S-transferase [Rhizopogon vinicolor AM-OR11-026]|uniref:glutathione transferase n=1 Tax=Rhizopogon vinicolor AM-OR11-026 TaxID=1314800 RepID=A0A1B7NB09_9AGAM|nr:glutathione S-transferase [Rhizopogon vinicolor AM-OR11-026]